MTEAVRVAFTKHASRVGPLTAHGSRRQPTRIQGARCSACSTRFPPASPPGRISVAGGAGPGGTMACRRRGGLLRTLLVCSGVGVCAATPGQLLPYTADHPVAQHAAADAAAATAPGALSVRPMPVTSLHSPTCVSPWSSQRGDGEGNRLWTGTDWWQCRGRAGAGHGGSGSASSAAARPHHFCGPSAVGYQRARRRRGGGYAGDDPGKARRE